MEVTHKKMVEHTREELMQFPELARKYLVNLFLLLLELRKSPEYIKNAFSIISQFKSRDYFVKAIKTKQIENFDSLFLSTTNVLLMAATFTDEEAKELYNMLCLLEENSLRNYLTTSNGVVISNLFSCDREFSWDYAIAWEILSLRTHLLTVTEAFRIEGEKPNLFKFLEKKIQPGEILSSVATSEICFYSLSLGGSRWRYQVNISPSPLSTTEYLVSVLEQ